MCRFQLERLHRNWIRQGFSLVILVVCQCFWSTPLPASEELQRFEFLQIRMGIPVRIVVYAANSASAIQGSDAAYERIRQIDRALSDYDPESEVSQLCRNSALGVPIAVQDDLATVLAASKKLTAESHGAFDVTIGPVVKLWRIARRKKQLPGSEAIKQALEHVGDHLIDFHSEDRTVTLHDSKLQLDFGGIAKGYAADEALRVLRDHGLPISLIAVAGDLRLGAPPPGKSGWRVEVEDKTLPESAERSPLILTLANQAVSTAGDSYQYLEVDGVRYSHLVDPRTGMGMTTPGSVTVIAPTGIEADGLDSTMVVLGPEAGLKLLETHPCCSALIVRLEQDGTRTVIQSPGWPR